MSTTVLPRIDVSSLRDGAGTDEVVRSIGEACRTWGFFYVTGHGVSEALQERLEGASRRFFALPDERKAEVRMDRGGRAWRGWFPVGGELTSGRPDLKEGLYFGAELPPDDPRVRAGTPLHGPNLFPRDVPELRPAVLEYLDAMTELGQALLRGIARSLGLPAGYFRERLTRDPLVLFRVFHYPPDPRGDSWGVGEHTDYGLLTILKQDDAGGLQVQTPSGWVDAPPLPGSFVCNLGDMLERMSGGLLRSTPHRVRNTSGRDRLSFPFFFDPSFEAEVRPIDVPDTALRDEDRRRRWDGASVHDLGGTYGDYLLAKVSKVFPQLRREVL